MTWDAKAKVYHYPCPCGDRFEISKHQLAECEDIATCPSCSLIIRVVYDPVRVVLFLSEVWRLTDAIGISLISRITRVTARTRRSCRVDI